MISLNISTQPQAVVARREGVRTGPAHFASLPKLPSPMRGANITAWVSPWPGPIKLSTGHVHVWRARLSDPTFIRMQQEYLSDEEKRRATRYRNGNVCAIVDPVGHVN